jgi:hypothetical protein
MAQSMLTKRQTVPYTGTVVYQREKYRDQFQYKPNNDVLRMTQSDAMSNGQRPSDDVSSVDDIDFMDKDSERCDIWSVSYLSYLLRYIKICK